MPLVNVMINNRAYTIACDEGEEDHLRQLAAAVDGKAREVLSSVGQVGTERLLLMAALLIADEHHSGKAEAADPSVQQMRADLEAQVKRHEEQSAILLDKAAQRLEQIAAGLAAA